jgi:uncharacterized protein
VAVDGLSDTDISRILRETISIAIVGASNKPERPSYGVMQFLLARGYHVVPVNPGHAGQTVLEQPVVASLADISAPIDMIDVFRNAADAGLVVDDAIALKDKLELKYVWLQLGIVNEIAAQRARQAGLQIVMDRCPKIEFARLALTR